MKRFITYLYEYKDGKKEKNVGFLRVDERRDVVNIEVCIKNHVYPDALAKLYGLIQKDSIIGFEWAEISLRGGRCNQKIVLEEKNFKDKKYSISDIIGVAVIFEDGRYLASCWKDAYAEVIANGKISFSTQEVLEEDGKVSDVIQAAEDTTEVETNPREDERPINHAVLYQKIAMEQIRKLPSSNWYLVDNSFLKHGVYNYGYLFLKKEMDGENEKMWLGVPGYYEKQEMLMAMLFGFPEFEPVPKTIVDLPMNVEKSISNIEKNQEPKTGVFGGWFVLLNK